MRARASWRAIVALASLVALAYAAVLLIVTEIAVPCAAVPSTHTPADAPASALASAPARTHACALIDAAERAAAHSLVVRALLHTVLASRATIAAHALLAALCVALARARRPHTLSLRTLLAAVLVQHVLMRAALSVLAGAACDAAALASSALHASACAWAESEAEGWVRGAPTGAAPALALVMLALCVGPADDDDDDDSGDVDGDAAAAASADRAHDDVDASSASPSSSDSGAEQPPAHHTAALHRRIDAALFVAAPFAGGIDVHALALAEHFFRFPLPLEQLTRIAPHAWPALTRWLRRSALAMLACALLVRIAAAAPASAHATASAPLVVPLLLVGVPVCTLLVPGALYALAYAPVAGWSAALRDRVTLGRRWGAGRERRPHQRWRRGRREPAGRTRALPRTRVGVVLGACSVLLVALGVAHVLAGDECAARNRARCAFADDMRRADAPLLVVAMHERAGALPGGAESAWSAARAYTQQFAWLAQQQLAQHLQLLWLHERQPVADAVAAAAAHAERATLLAGDAPPPLRARVVQLDDGGDVWWRAAGAAAERARFVLFADTTHVPCRDGVRELIEAACRATQRAAHAQQPLCGVVASAGDVPAVLVPADTLADMLGPAGAALERAALFDALAASCTRRGAALFVTDRALLERSDYARYALDARMEVCGAPLARRLPAPLARVLHAERITTSQRVLLE